MKRLIPLMALAAMAISGAARAQSLSDIPINADTQLFCPDGRGDPQLFVYSKLGGVMKRYDERFHFDMSVEPGRPLILKFSRPSETPYSITYEIEPYRDNAGRKGILLNKMHIFLENADRDISGTPMCFFTEFGK